MSEPLLHPSSERAPAAAVSAASFEIPRWLLGRGEIADTLDLTPIRPGHPTIRLVARDRFLIGRSIASADFPTRLRAGSGGLEELKALSRVHALLEMDGGEAALRDGDGRRPSTNGSAFDGAPLDCTRPVHLKRKGLLSLSGSYLIEVHRVAGKSGEAFAPSNLPEWRGASGRQADASPPRPAGAVFLVPQAGAPTLRDAVWLLSAIAFSEGERGRLQWNDGTEGAGGWFVHLSGGFWLARDGQCAGDLRLDDSPMRSGSIAPLASGQVVSLGGLQFAVSAA